MPFSTLSSLVNLRKACFPKFFGEEEKETSFDFQNSIYRRLFLHSKYKSLSLELLRHSEYVDSVGLYPIPQLPLRSIPQFDKAAPLLPLMQRLKAVLTKFTSRKYNLSSESVLVARLYSPLIYELFRGTDFVLQEQRDLYISMCPPAFYKLDARVTFDESLLPDGERFKFVEQLAGLCIEYQHEELVPGVPHKDEDKLLVAMAKVLLGRVKMVLPLGVNECKGLTVLGFLIGGLVIQPVLATPHFGPIDADGKVPVAVVFNTSHEFGRLPIFEVGEFKFDDEKAENCFSDACDRFCVHDPLKDGTFTLSDDEKATCNKFDAAAEEKLTLNWFFEQFASELDISDSEIYRPPKRQKGNNTRTTSSSKKSKNLALILNAKAKDSNIQLTSLQGLINIRDAFIGQERLFLHLLKKSVALVPEKPIPPPRSSSSSSSNSSSQSEADSDDPFTKEFFFEHQFENGSIPRAVYSTADILKFDESHNESPVRSRRPKVEMNTISVNISDTKGPHYFVDSDGRALVSITKSLNKYEWYIYHLPVVKGNPFFTRLIDWKPLTEDTVVLTLPAISCSLRQISSAFPADNLNGETVDWLLSGLLLGIMTALRTLHLAGFVHSDVSAGNVCFGTKERVWKLIDFNQSLPIKISLRRPRIFGTRPFVSKVARKTGIVAPVDDYIALANVVLLGFPAEFYSISLLLQGPFGAFVKEIRDAQSIDADWYKRAIEFHFESCQKLNFTDDMTLKYCK